VEVTLGDGARTEIVENPETAAGRECDERGNTTGYGAASGLGRKEIAAGLNSAWR